MVKPHEHVALIQIFIPLIEKPQTRVTVHLLADKSILLKFRTSSNLFTNIFFNIDENIASRTGMRFDSYTV